MSQPALAVVIPAHDEAGVIGRLLTRLSDRTVADEIIVVCDGCSDDTASIARSFDGVTVLEQPQGGKPAALNRGDQHASVFPRFYVDADICVDMMTLREAARQMTGGIEAGAPRMTVDVGRSSWSVRRFYEIWTELPYARSHLLGSGVMGMTQAGRARFDRFPDVIGDDEFVRRLFAVEERVVSTSGAFLVTAPRDLSSLIAIKTRGRTGIRQLDQLQGSAPPESGAPGRTALTGFLGAPSRWPALLVFGLVRIVVHVLSERRVRRADFSRWDRDESSRSLPKEPG